MKGWLEANAYGKEVITRELLEAAKAARDFIEDLNNEGMGRLVSKEGANLFIKLSDAIAKAEGRE